MLWLVALVALSIAASNFEIFSNSSLSQVSASFTSFACGYGDCIKYIHVLLQSRLTITVKTRKLQAAVPDYQQTSIHFMQGGGIE